MGPADPPLNGRVILLPRPSGHGEALARALRALGARVEMRPAIALEPPADAEPARRALARLERYEWLLFTSASGVRFFVSMRDQVGRGKPETSPAIGAIGPSTARELIRAGLAPTVIAEDSRSEGLARALDQRVLPGQRVLLVQPEVARPVLIRALRGLGAFPEAVAFYRNVPAPGIEGLVRDICANRFDVVLLTSPSTLHRLLEVPDVRREEVKEALGRARLVAIGQVTAHALVEAGLTADSVADEPSDEGVTRSILSLYP
jgi:uroporphyrinogen-III synthase